MQRARLGGRAARGEADVSFVMLWREARDMLRGREVETANESVKERGNKLVAESGSRPEVSGFCRQRERKDHASVHVIRTVYDLAGSTDTYRMYL